jgi:uncharacterized Zn finger protein (UPF0148 family)
LVDNVISLATPSDPEPRLWVCGHCGSRHFELYEDGSTVCALCEFKDEDQRGNWHETVKPDEKAEKPEFTRTITPYATIDFARQAVLKAPDEDTCAILVLWPNGRIRAWSVYDRTSDDKAKADFRNLLRQAEELLIGKPGE